MGKYHIELTDGRKFEVESDGQPSEQDILPLLQGDVGVYARRGLEGNEPPNAGAIAPLAAPLALVGKGVSSLGNMVARAFGHDEGQPVFSEDPTATVPPMFEAGKPIVQSQFVNEDIDPVNRVVGNLLRSLTTPESVATLGAGKVLNIIGKVEKIPSLITASKVGPAALFGGQMVSDAPETTKEAAKALGTLSGTPEGQRTEGMKDVAKEKVMEEVLNKLFLGVLGYGGVESLKRGDGIEYPEVLPPDASRFNPKINQPRQIEQPAIDVEEVPASGQGATGLRNLLPYDAASFEQGAKGLAKEGQDSGILENQSDAASKGLDGKSKGDLARYNELVEVMKSKPTTEAWQELEGIKNKYGGKPPKDVTGAGETEADLQEQLNEERKKGKLYGGMFFLDPDFWQGQLGVAKHAKMDAMQLYNRVRNKLGEQSAAWKMLDTEDFKGFMKGVRTPQEVEEWVKENGPRVEVRKFENYDADKAGREMSELEHKLDTLGFQAKYNQDGDAIVGWETRGKEITPEVKTLMDEFKRRYNTIGNRNESATAHWSSIAPKAEKDMPGYVEIAVVKPTYDAQHPRERAIHQFPSSHNFPPNTLGFVRGYMEGDTFHVVEVQSDWAQSQREYKERVDAGEAGPLMHREKGGQNDPLLQHYERLALKAAIEHAREQGAKRIAISDAETAMLTEGHDRQTRAKIYDADNKEQAMRLANGLHDKGIKIKDVFAGQEGKWHVQTNEPIISQEQGMRLHYDQTLPRILSELTGEKGERVEFGEHKMAFDPEKLEPIPNTPGEYMDTRTGDTYGREAGVSEFGQRPRKDLIFRNPDGTPKISVTARSFPLTKAKENFTFTGSDKPKAPVQSPTAKGLGTGLKEKIEQKRSSESGSILNPFKKTNRAIKQSEFQDFTEFKPYSQEVIESTTPQGIGKVPGLSRLFDPRAYRTSPDAKAIIANAAMTQKGQNLVALWMERQKDVQRAFPVDKNGKVTLASGKKSYLSDVVEAEMANPGSQPLTPSQKEFVRQWTMLRDKLVKWAQKEGVKSFVDDNGNIIPLDENYFPRPAVGKEGIKETVKDTVKRSIGGKQFFQKGRHYDTEAQGVQAGLKYDPDEFSRIARFMSSLYKAVADTRMANDPALSGRSGTTPKFLEEGMVFQPAFQGRVFPKEVADRLNRYYGESIPNWVRGAANVNDALKAAQFTLDASAPFNQGLPLMGVNPYRWARATVRQFQAFLDDRVLNKVMKDPENVRVAKAIIENGGSLVRLQDFLQGAEKGKIMEKIAPIRASGRAMGTFLSLAKMEMFKAFEPIAKEKGWSTQELVEAVENATLSGRMESIGLSHGRAVGERLIFNAPSYIRGAANLVSMAGQGGISGRVARRALIGMAAAISLQMYFLYKHKGLSNKEIEERFTPGSNNFLKYPYTMANGQNREIGYGNILISLAHVIGDTVEIAEGKKKLGVGTEGDPWLRWLSYRKSPLGNIVWQIGTGKDYMGEDVGKLETLGRSLVPVSVEPSMERGSLQSSFPFLTEQGRAGVGSQLLGLSSYNESPGTFRNRQMDELSQQKYGKYYDSLTANQRRTIIPEAQQRMKALGSTPSPSQLGNLAKADEERRLRVVAGLSKPVQDWLESNNLRVSNYSQTKTEMGKQIRLASPEEQQRLEELVIEKTEQLLKPMVGRKVSQEVLNTRLEMAHKRAWVAMKAEMYKNSKKE